MIKLKDILLESNPPNLLIPRRIEGRVEKYVQAKLSLAKALEKSPKPKRIIVVNLPPNLTS